MALGASPRDGAQFFLMHLSGASQRALLLCKLK